MPWTPPFTANAGDVISATAHNTGIRDNLTYLFNGRSASFVRNTSGLFYSTTSTVFVPVDTTNLRLTATVNSGRFLVFASGVWKHSVTTGLLNADIQMDSTTLAGGPQGLAYQEMGNVGSALWSFSLMTIFTGVSVGTHTFDLMWRTSVATAYIYGTLLNSYIVGMEV